MWTLPEKTFSCFSRRENISPSVDFDNSSWLRKAWRSPSRSFHVITAHNCANEISIPSIPRQAQQGANPFLIRPTLSSLKVNLRRKKVCCRAAIVNNKTSPVVDVGSCAGTINRRSDEEASFNNAYSERKETSPNLIVDLRGLMDVHKSGTGPSPWYLTLDPRRVNY